MLECTFFETSDDVPDPRDLSMEKKNLMVFDDLMLEKQNKCETYYIRGRHSNTDCFYLSCSEMRVCVNRFRSIKCHN